MEVAVLLVHQNHYSPHIFLHKPDPLDHLRVCPLAHLVPLKAFLLDLLNLCPLVLLKACLLAHLEECHLAHLMACPLDLPEECLLAYHRACPPEECPLESVHLMDGHQIPLLVGLAVSLDLLSMDYLHNRCLMGHLVVDPL